jgi:hypothetical protein
MVHVVAPAWICDVIELRTVGILSKKLYKPRIPDITSRNLRYTKIFAMGAASTEP